MRHCWVDHIEVTEPGVSATGRKAVAFSEDFFADHFPGNPVFPGIYIVEGMAQTAGSQLESFASRMQERLTYKTGEIAGAGTLECKECGQILRYEKPTRIPPCPKCRNTLFRRGF